MLNLSQDSNPGHPDQKQECHALNRDVRLCLNLLTTKQAYVAVRSKVPTVLVLSNRWIVGSNPAQDMAVCPCISILCCPV